MVEESHFLRHAQDRVREFQPNPGLDEIIRRLQGLLGPVQQQVNHDFVAPARPVVIVVGCPRSGTTLVSQLLASCGGFAYPSNLLSRFAYAPYIGALIQQMLFDPSLGHRDELGNLQSNSDFSSRLGKTSGALAVSEFFHFWRRFFPIHDPGHLSPDECAAVDIPGMRAELAALESVWGRPFASKGMMLQYNLDYFMPRMPELFVLHVKRDPRYVLQSVLQSRRAYYDTDSIWWSVKPREFPQLVDRSPVEQVAGQVHYTVRAIDRALDQMPSAQSLTVSYEHLCDQPGAWFADLQRALAERGETLPEFELPDSFPCGNRDRLPEAEIQALLEAYEALGEDTGHA